MLRIARPCRIPTRQPRRRLREAGWLLWTLFVGVATPIHAVEPEEVSFSRDVRPLLSQHCYACHGPDDRSRKAGLRLDRGDAALAELKSGARAVVPHDPEASELIARITSEDASLRMPPASTGHTLSAEQVGLLSRWIESGARFDDHWSFRPVEKTQPPPVRDAAWVRNPIDAFILARLEREGVAPAPEADRATLARRLSLDLLGLPPEPAVVAAFLADESPDAYTRLVERFLTSPHFGERWGRHWLDLAHYADSDGYLEDAFRKYAWLYRDWVIDAINQDLPFDRFTIEQLAGDLLPEAGLKERTATGFLRNSMRNFEAGADLEEYRLQEIVDRVSTVGLGWLGLSVGCAECHSHKFDPISQVEFYQLFAFFNDADDVDVDALQPGEMEAYQAKHADWARAESKLASAMNARFAEQSKPLQDALATVVKKRSPDQIKRIDSILKSDDDEARQLCLDYESHALNEPARPSTRAMALSKRKVTRSSFVHLRGDYKRRGEDVTPGTLAVLPPFQARGEHADRLDLARWLVAPENPLTPRVTVNRIWQHLFGRGLVSTVDNFGSAGEAPSHPELLDWLAGELIGRGWSRKEMIRLIVNSATYRQSSAGRDELIARDPLNVWLARQSRFRLEAEVVRDVALASSGLLERKLGGPGIRPPQPDYVASISRNVEWKVSTGPDLYRRGMYIVFRRATPYPMLMTFDAPDSSVACSSRERTNSPLQALTLLNDPVFFECAQALGAALDGGPPRSFHTRLREGFQRVLGRDPSPAEVERLRTFFDEHCGQFAADEESVADTSVRAAWIVTARVLMNLDEFINRE